jgi:predicted secreted Zn-dependent protease
MPSSVHEQHIKDALLVIWDILGDLNVDDDPEITKKRDQLRKVLSAIDVPKSTAKKARAIVDAQLPDATVDA